MQFFESETVELKEVVVEDIKKEIIAFANCDGGKLYVGVSDDGRITGVDNPDQAMLQISNMARDAIKPDVTMFLHYKVLVLEEKKVIEIDIQRGTDRPYYLAKKGLRPEGVFVRQGTSSVASTDTAIRRMIKETDGDSFEERRSLEQELTFQTAEKEFNERGLAFGAQQMKTLGLMHTDGIYTNLGLLLSEQCTHTAKAAVFEGTEQSVFKDRREFSGSILQQLTDIFAYIQLCNHTQSTFDKLRRIDTRDYPEAAVREALLNSIVHRDYSFHASTIINVYDDRMEFISIGGLLSGITLADVMLGLSVCRNPKLANVFYRLELIEAYGTGMRKIMNAYAGSGKMPEIQTTDNAFKIVLPNRNAYAPKACPNGVGEYSGDIYTAEGYVGDGRRKEECPEEKTVLELAGQRGFVSRREIEETLKLSQSTAGRLLKQMIKSGLLVTEGRGRNTRYRLR